MKLLITGANGILGYALTKECKKQKLEYVAMTRADADLTDTERVTEFISRQNPDVVIHCAAYTQVDKAESEPEFCFAVNAGGTKAVAEACEKTGAALCCISTDYVFDGAGDKPHPESEQPSPLSVYGKSKYKSECIAQTLQKHYIVRSSWTYGDTGKSFLGTMLRLGKEKETISVVNDQIGAPVYANELAELLLKLVKTERYGIYHATGQGECSFAEYAAYIMETAGLPAKIVPVSSEEYVLPAKRPKNSRLSMEELKKAGLELLPDWKQSVKRAIEVQTAADRISGNK